MPFTLVHMSRMWPLAAFRFDDGIEARQVHLVNEATGELDLLSRADAIALAHARGANLIASWPNGGDTPSCFVGKLSLPPRWEAIPPEDHPDLDERLWFEAPCGGRDLLLQGQGHTFPGRMSAWCPHESVAYNVSLAEMGNLSDEARYFVLGFLSGNEPAPAMDDEGMTDAADLEAWQSATARFRRTGGWYGRWGTCSVCGCVLLPDSAADRCHEHQEPGP
jgi:hypothetical protein